LIDHPDDATFPALERHRLWRFYDACARAEMPETSRLATTIDTWWPAIAVALAEQVTNARTEGFNRIIKSASAAGSATSTTINGASWPTSRSPDRDETQHDETTPLICEGPGNPLYWVERRVLKIQIKLYQVACQTDLGLMESPLR
jgi:hypothetical protein